MTTSKQYRARAAAYRGLVEESSGPEQRQELHALEQSFTTLADNQQWLENNHDNILHAPRTNKLGNMVANEERMLQCLGAALILQWNTLPAKLQRELFDAAGSIGDASETSALRGQVACFLHKHKDDET